MSATTEEVHHGRIPQQAGRARDLLFALFQGGGNLALILPIVQAAVARGHAVRVLAGPGVWRSRAPVSASLRERIALAGARYVPFSEPDIHPLDTPPHPRGVLCGWTPGPVARVTWYVPPYRWAGPWAINVAAELRRERAEIVVADFLLPGALVAAEALGVPAVSLVHGIYKHRPAWGLPPYGTGFRPARGLLAAARDALWAASIRHVYTRDAQPALNRARCALGLPSLPCMYDQFDRAARVLVLTDRAFDFEAHALPANVRYVGTPMDDARASAWISPWPEDDRRPLLVVSLSTLAQGQGPVLQRILPALADLPIKALVTLGPALNVDQFRAPPNVIIEQFVPHAAVLPQAAAMITQCGIGGVIKALRIGVPLVCIPLVGDQRDNAARVIAHGAGVRLSKNASSEQIRRATQQVLSEPGFRENARRLASRMGSRDGAETALIELESLAQQRPR